MTRSKEQVRQLFESDIKTKLATMLIESMEITSIRILNDIEITISINVNNDTKIISKTNFSI